MRLDIEQEALRARIYKQNAADQTADHTWREPAHALEHVTKATLPKSCRFTGKMRNAADQNHFVREFVGKMPGAKTADHTLCKPAQSKCTWTLHKSHFEREFTGKMPWAKTTTHTLCEPARLEIHADIAQEPFFAENCG